MMGFTGALCVGLAVQSPAEGPKGGIAFIKHPDGSVFVGDEADDQPRGAASAAATAPPAAAAPPMGGLVFVRHPDGSMFFGTEGDDDYYDDAQDSPSPSPSPSPSDMILLVTNATRDLEDARGPPRGVKRARDGEDPLGQQAAVMKSDQASVEKSATPSSTPQIGSSIVEHTKH